MYHHLSSPLHHPYIHTYIHAHPSIPFFLTRTAERKTTSKLLAPTKTSDKIYQVDGHIATVVAGLTSDANILLNQVGMLVCRWACRSMYVCMYVCMKVYMYVYANLLHLYSPGSLGSSALSVSISGDHSCRAIGQIDL